MPKKCRIIKRTYPNQLDESTGNPVVRFTIQRKGSILFWVWFDASLTELGEWPPEDTFRTFEEAMEFLPYWDGSKYEKSEEVVYP